MAIPSSALLQNCQDKATITPPSSPFRHDANSPTSSMFNINERKTRSVNTKNPGNLAHHNYHDHKDDSESSCVDTPKRSSITPFPLQLHVMLETIEEIGKVDVVSWQPHGRCFVIHDQKEFIRIVMPAFMKQSKFPSFRRQLNLYGFQRISTGPDQGGYYHELFLRGRPFLTRRMQRQCIKGTRVRCRSNPKEEPNFYDMEPVRNNVSGSNNEEKPMKACDFDLAEADRVLSCVPSANDVAFFAGKKFHVINDATRMDTFLPWVTESKHKLTIVENDDEAA
eukprot:CAMPEP_0194205706 /NCGR_PEP_ID=MMETSP0156-20130528/4930_1 /TAXON_ID=33649 /ORGANISM="Thalassionema nitzschioides, Strain L26-B" /LENGTH=280 /DNA_ID=CAMNT_0038932061 /DNA_START=59 /DNA_END=898 /DNA_ORIENTATION=-